MACRQPSVASEAVRSCNHLPAWQTAAITDRLQTQGKAASRFRGQARAAIGFLWRRRGPTCWLAGGWGGSELIRKVPVHHFILL